MTTMRLVGDPDNPELQCDSCGMIFQVIWQNNGHTEGIEYCPFCGTEVEEFETEWSEE